MRDGWSASISAGMEDTNMTRPTEKEAYEGKCRRLIKKIWEKELKQSIEECPFVGFDPTTPAEPIFIILRTDKEKIQVHRSRFDECFNSENKEKQEYSTNILRELLARHFLPKN